MTTAEYLREERLAILTQGATPTRQQEQIAAEQVRQWEADQALDSELALKLDNIQRLAQVNRRDYHLQKRFGK